ncbi:hypothetical protein C9374_002855 [Naegleria lovaniensis]|uniref:Protein kinase domain-containing protein n=1 Tax=Naegleria lovaniensis TaxID=51637 RepID=A0AA88KM07_NAELO|nr:uncharacterized protein C9374_002855 [Naegleria lovaniensis]KAG2386409.1 hypothetical protein C9374_002855 [Naegleria lovaniensis]
MNRHLLFALHVAQEDCHHPRNNQEHYNAQFKEETISASSPTLVQNQTPPHTMDNSNGYYLQQSNGVICSMNEHFQPTFYNDQEEWNRKRKMSLSGNSNDSTKTALMACSDKSGEYHTLVSHDGMRVTQDPKTVRERYCSSNSKNHGESIASQSRKSRIVGDYSGIIADSLMQATTQQQQPQYSNSTVAQSSRDAALVSNIMSYNVNANHVNSNTEPQYGNTLSHVENSQLREYRVVMRQKFGDGIQFIGQGGFAAVFKINDHEVIKIIEMTGRKHERKEERACEFNHHHIVKVFSYLYETHTFHNCLCEYLLLRMQYYPLGSLNCYPQLSTLMLWKVMNQIAQALQYLSLFNMVHRDVKPANILVERLDFQQQDIHVVLGDFGLTRDLQTVSNENNPGTSAFMAPEILNKPNIDFSTLSDIYALGKSIEVMQQHVEDPTLSKFVKRMTHPMKSERPSLREIIHHSSMMIHQQKI